MQKQKNMVPELRFPGFTGEWEDVKLGEVSKITTGSTPNTKEKKYYDGNHLFVSPVDISQKQYIDKTQKTLSDEGFSKCRAIPKNSVLFVCIGSTIGKIALAPRKLATNQQINSITSNTKSSNIYIYYSLSKIAPRIKLLAGIQAVPIINKSQFSKTKLNLPSLPEQQKIADFLTTVDTWLETLKTQKDSLQNYKKGMMQKIFSQQVRFTADDGNSFPEWKEVKLGEIFQERKDRAGENKYQLLSVSQTKGIQKQTESIKRDLSSSNKSNYKVVKVGDIAYNTMRMWQGAFGVSTEVGIVSPAYTVITAQIGLVNFWKYFLKQKRIIFDFYRYSQGLTSDTWNLKFHNFSRINVFAPNSKQEQQKIADFLTSLDDLIDDKSTEIQKAETWKKGLMQKLFV